MKSILAGAALFVAIASHACAAEYLEERYPLRFALVIGNYDYAHADDLPSASADVEGITKALRKANFDVTTAANLASYDAFRKVLNDFSAKVSDDDLVVVYFSGHGFIRSGNSFIVGTSMPQPMAPRDVNRYAVSVETIPDDFFRSKRLGAIVLLVDACRSLGVFQTTSDNTINKGGQADIPKGPTMFAMGLATRDGSIATGYTDKNTMSTYTRAIASHIAREDTEFWEVYQDIGADVLIDTADQEEPQQPGIFGYWVTRIYFNPTEKTYKEQKALWLAALNDKSRKTVEKFSHRYALSPFAREARAWLDRNPETLVPSYTRVSPTAIEEAYGAARENAPVQVPINGQFGWNRFQDLTATRASSECCGEESGEMPTGEERIVLEQLSARARPNLGGEIVGQLKARERIVLKEVFENNGQTWAKVRAPKLGDADAYVKVTPPSSTQEITLGRALATIVIPTEPTNPSMLSVAAVESALEQMRKSGKTITWVSLSTAPTEDEILSTDHVLQLAQAKYLLSQRGIDTKTITSIAGSPGTSSAGVTMKISGY